MDLVACGYSALSSLLVYQLSTEFQSLTLYFEYIYSDSDILSLLSAQVQNGHVWCSVGVKYV